jgi:phage terminase small subunit
VALNPKQASFAREYLVDRNATQAAIRAGYSAGTAYSQGARLLKHVEVQQAIDAGTQRVAAKVETKAESVLGELNGLAGADLLEAFCKDGTLKNLADMPPEFRRCIKSLEFTELFEGASGEKFVSGRIVKLQLWDKPKALELLGKHLKLFTDKVELSGKLTLAELVEAAAKSPEAG